MCTSCAHRINLLLIHRSSGISHRKWRACFTPDPSHAPLFRLATREFGRKTQPKGDLPTSKKSRFQASEFKAWRGMPHGPDFPSPPLPYLQSQSQSQRVRDRSKRRLRLGVQSCLVPAKGAQESRAMVPPIYFILFPKKPSSFMFSCDRLGRLAIDDTLVPKAYLSSLT